MALRRMQVVSGYGGFRRGGWKRKPFVIPCLPFRESWIARWEERDLTALKFSWKMSVLFSQEGLWSIGLAANDLHDKIPSGTRCRVWTV